MGLWRAIREANADFLFIPESQVATTEQVRNSQLARLRDQAARRVIDSESAAQLEARAAGIGFENLAPEDSPWRTFRETATDPATLAESAGRAGGWVGNLVGGGVSGLTSSLLSGLVKHLWWILLLAGLYFAWRAGLLKNLLKS